MIYFNELKKVNDWDSVETGSEMYKLHDDAGDIYMTMVSEDMCRIIINKKGEHIDLTHNIIHELIKIMDLIYYTNENN